MGGWGGGGGGDNLIHCSAHIVPPHIFGTLQGGDGLSKPLYKCFRGRSVRSSPISERKYGSHVFFQSSWSNESLCLLEHNGKEFGVVFFFSKQFI
jgi:hypothetical protein